VTVGVIATLAGLAVAAPGAAAAVPGLGASANQVREALAAQSARTLAGDPVSLAAAPGEVVIVHFWASWCAPCRKELPRLDRLHGEMRGRGGRVVAVSIDRERGNAERFARARRLALPIVHDGPDNLARRLDLRAVPLSIVLDRDGEVALTSRRSDAAGIAALESAVRALLAAPVATRPSAGGAP